MERTFPEVEAPAMLDVKDRILEAGTGPEANGIVEANAGVEAHSGRLGRTPGDGCAPAEIVLARRSDVIRQALSPQNLYKASTFGDEHPSVVHGRVAPVQADLVATFRKASQQRLNLRRRDVVPAVEGGAPAAQEVVRRPVSLPFVHVHQPVEVVERVDMTQAERRRGRVEPLTSVQPRECS